ncbi:hypothetical protein PseBG33_1217 [Pseudomonas synxantha BG33R]|nr:hypothetical protein PseBG33_1217 [Pseudomonas synxantha BG33R]
MIEETAFPEAGRMTPAEIDISEEALRFARSNKKSIAKRLTDKAIYPSEESPVSVFMAGSPGAGKTEASIALVNLFADTPILKIDPDELRKEFAAYQGANSWLFQQGVSILVEKIVDLALDQRQSFLLDGTFSNLEIARSNVERSLRKGRSYRSCTCIKTPCLLGISADLAAKLGPPSGAR